MSASEKGSTHPAQFGFLALIVKFGPKLVGGLAKIASTLVKSKSALALATFGGYAILFDWRFVLLIMGSLLFHEYGHVWSMRRHGVPVKGVYFIPFMGAAAVGTGAAPTRLADAEIALMGPIWGFVLATATLLLGMQFDSPFITGCAGWMAALNLFNLLPIWPLDGGRLLATVARSISGMAGRALMLWSMGALALLALCSGQFLFFILIPIGAVELLGEFRRTIREEDHNRILRGLGNRLQVAPDPEVIINAIRQGIHRIQTTDLRYLPMVPIHHIQLEEDRTLNESEFAALHEQITRQTLLQDFISGISTFVALKTTIGVPVTIDPDHPEADHPLFIYLRNGMETIPSLNARQCVVAFTGYFSLIGCLFTVLVAASTNPAAVAALELFTK